MPNTLLHQSKLSLAYAKLVATPTDSAWSQVYNAGNLFACLSLTVQEPNEDISLATLGKELINNLEAEFFTLEAKDISSIKNAISESIQNLPKDIALSMCLAFFKENALYLFIAGAGKVVMKRDETIGVLLEKQKDEEQSILTASGYVHGNDSIILQTEQFAQDISDEILTTAFEVSLPNDIAEAISPQLHTKSDGGQAAIIIVAHGSTHDRALPEETEDNEEETIEEELTPSLKKQLRLPTIPKIHLPGLHLNKRKKFFLFLALVVVMLLGSGIYLTKQQQEHTQTRALFDSIYPPAQKKYDEGKGLENLNQNLSQEDYQKAKELLAGNQNKFAPNSFEAKQVADLLQKINAELTPQTATNLPKAQKASDTASTRLSTEKNTSALSFTQTADPLYYLTNSAIMDDKKKTLVKNDNDWGNAVALSAYQGNIYVLDTQKGVIKFVAGGGGYAKSTYLKGSTPDLSKAVAISIDSSVWILKSDGSLLKYTSGAPDSFSIKGLDKALNKPTKLLVTRDLSNIYILDNGNGRVVVLGKDCTFKTQYPADVLTDAKDFDVSESDKKIYILSKGTIWEVNMK